MDEDGIGLVLARASELRSKITNCIRRASMERRSKLEEQEREDKVDGTLSESKIEETNEGEEEDVGEEEADSILNIRDAFESLEAQLSSLQTLQQQQWYEREAALAEIDYSRKKLLKQLKEYKGENLEVIKEATTFASETVEENNDLLLPPYPTRPSRSLLSDNGYLSHFSSTRKIPPNGIISGETRKNLYESEEDQLESQSQPQNRKGLRFFINAAAKVLTVVGVVSILGLAGFEPRLRKRDNEFKIFSIFQHREVGGETIMVNCPPGKVLVMEGGEARCLVKERIEIPFKSVVATPDISYGCG